MRAKRVKLGASVRRLREAMGMTQLEFASHVGITSVYVSQLENNNGYPSQAMIDRLSRLFGIDLYVMSWCDEVPPSGLSVRGRRAVAWLRSEWEARLKVIAKARLVERSLP